MGELEGLLTGALPSMECLKLSVSKGLSTGIVAGAVMVKVPQIQRILAKRSVEGLRFQMFASEVIGSTVAIAYFIGRGMALAAYAELFFILAQNLVILTLMGIYGDKGRKTSGLAGLAPAGIAYAAMIFVLATGMIPQQYLEWGYNATTLMLIYGRAPQIAANFAAKSTGELSQMTQVLMSAGSAARIFTTMQEGGSPSMIGAYVLSSSMNCVILAQMFLYGGASKKKKA